MTPIPPNNPQETIKSFAAFWSAFTFLILSLLTAVELHSIRLDEEAYAQGPKTVSLKGE